VDFAGTFPLPEAQLDRFSVRISLGYLNAESEVEMLERLDGNDPLSQLKAVAGEDDVRDAQQAISLVHVSPDLKNYIVRLVSASREHPDLSLGASPRASLALYRLAQARAAAAARDFVLPDDVKALTLPALSHRLLFKPSAEMRGAGPETLLRQLLDAEPVPQAPRPTRV
jgi:MoxR-like ATPase